MAHIVPNITFWSLFFIILVEVNNTTLTFTTYLPAVLALFLPKLASPSGHSSFVTLVIESPLSASRAVTIRRACLESQQRRTEPFKKGPGRSVAPRDLTLSV